MTPKEHTAMPGHSAFSGSTNLPSPLSKGSCECWPNSCPMYQQSAQEYKEGIFSRDQEQVMGKHKSLITSRQQRSSQQLLWTEPRKNNRAQTGFKEIKKDKHKVQCQSLKWQQKIPVIRNHYHTKHLTGSYSNSQPRVPPMGL